LTLSASRPSFSRDLALVLSLLVQREAIDATATGRNARRGVPDLVWQKQPAGFRVAVLKYADFTPQR